MVLQPAPEPTADPEERLISGNVDVATLALKLEMAKAKAARAPEVAELERQFADAGRIQAQVLEQAGYRPSGDAGAAATPAQRSDGSTRVLEARPSNEKSSQPLRSRLGLQGRKT